MVRTLYLLILMSTAGLFLVGESEVRASAASAETCSNLQLKLGTCVVATSSGDYIELRGSQSNSREMAVGKPGAGYIASGKPRLLTNSELQALFDEACYGGGLCSTRNPGRLNPVIPTEEGADAPAAQGQAAQVVTVADVARLLPARGVLHAEPDGWAVVGVPANFWVEVAPMTAVGELLGKTAEVRFTPRLYRFDYGDGGSRATASPGSSWQALGQQELTATATGHVYRERGAMSASVAVVYAAEYRVGGGAWIPVDGAVTAEAPAADVLVVTERTVLTAGAVAG